MIKVTAWLVVSAKDHSGVLEFDAVKAVEQLIQGKTVEVYDSSLGRTLELEVNGVAEADTDD